MGMGNTYYDMNEMDKAIAVYKTIIRSLDAGYMDEKNAAELKLINLANLSLPLGKQGRHEEALAVAEEGLEMAVSRGYAHTLVELLMNVAGNRMKLARQMVESEKKGQELNATKKMMQQAYYIAAARKDKYNQELIKENLKYHFGEKL